MDKIIYKKDNESIWKLSKNKNIPTIEKSKLSLDTLMELYFKGMELIYVTVDGILFGIIAEKELNSSLKEKKAIVNTSGKRIYANNDTIDYQQAMDIFSLCPSIHNIPVVDEGGYLLFEYRKDYQFPEDVKAYLDRVTIEYGLNTSELRKQKIVVSLTSYGERLKTVYLTILSIMSQTMKPDKIILYVGEESVQFINKKLLSLQNKGLTIIKNVENIRVHKKYYYAMQEYPDDLLITVDDDVMYEDTLIESLYASYCEYPDAISGRRVHKMKQKNGIILPYNQWESCVTSNFKPNFSLINTGCGGVLYPPHCMDERVFDLDLIKKLAFYQDDLWLKYMQLLANTKTKFVEGKSQTPVTIPNSQKISCCRLNCGIGWNDICIEKLSNYFNLNLADYCL